MPKRLVICAVAAAVGSAAAVLPAGPADASTYQRCKSADLRYPFMEGQPNHFGVFRLRIDGGGCAKAHRVAKAWMDDFEGHISDGVLKLPTRVLGFKFKSLTPTAAQTYNERGRKGATTIRFDYRVPNG